MVSDPENKDKQTKIVVLYCQNCVAADADIEAQTGHLEDITIEPVMIVCSSKIQVPNLLQILDDDADAVEIIACSEKVCRFLVGSRKAEKRINYARDLLSKADINPERLGITTAAGLSVDDFIEIGRKRAETINS